MECHNPGLGSARLRGLGILGSVLLKDHRGVARMTLFFSRVAFLQVCFCCVFVVSIFPTLTQKSINNGVQFDPESMNKCVGSHLGKKVSKIVPEISICSALFQEADLLQTE